MAQASSTERLSAEIELALPGKPRPRRHWAHGLIGAALLCTHYYLHLVLAVARLLTSLFDRWHLPRRGAWCRRVAVVGVATVLSSVYRTPENLRWLQRYAYPPGASVMEFRPAECDAYVLLAGSPPLNLVRLALRGSLRWVSPAIRTTARRTFTVVPLVYYHLQKRLPRDDNLAVYAAYWYRGYACNPRAIYEKARELVPWVHGVWVVRKDVAGLLPAGVDYVVEGSARYLRVMARAKYLINNVNFPHAMSKRSGSVHVQTQHGTPLKTMGLDLQCHPVAAQGMNFARLRDHCARWDFAISANPMSSHVWRRVYPGNYEMLEIGYPRNDRFFRVTDEEVARIRAGLGIAPEQTAILYAPTHREYQSDFLPLLGVSRIAAALGRGYVLLARAHYFSGADAYRAPDTEEEARVVDVSEHPSVEDLCLASDVLLTDYSSIMFDYANLDRPIVIYAPDWEIYKRTRGVYFDLLAEPPGAAAMTEDELIAHFQTGEVCSAASAKARAEFRRHFCVYDDGHAAERVVRRVFLSEPLASGGLSSGRHRGPTTYARRSRPKSSGGGEWPNTDSSDCAQQMARPGE